VRAIARELARPALNHVAGAAAEHGNEAAERTGRQRSTVLTMFVPARAKQPPVCTELENRTASSLPSERYGPDAWVVEKWVYQIDDLHSSLEASTERCAHDGLDRVTLLSL
jgi:hypothetical protein